MDDESQLHRRLEKIVEDVDINKLKAVDHGMVVGYEGDRPIETTKSTITRVGNHSKYGFRELRVKPATPGDILHRMDRGSK